MPSIQGYRLSKQVVQQKRPLGVGVLATIGILASLGALVIALVRLPGLLSIRPGLQLAMDAGVLVVALVSLWINWGFWEQIRWAWWANLLLSLITIGGLITALRWVQPLGAALSNLRPSMAPGQASAAVMAGLLALLVYHLVVILYMLSARVAFGVGVKDDRPLWERARR